MPTRSNESCIREENFLQVRDNYDVIVAGGGVAGAAAAIAARRLGAKTLLLEKSGVPGGLATSGLVAGDCRGVSAAFRQVRVRYAARFLEGEPGG